MPHEYHFNFNDDIHICLQKLKAKTLLESGLEIDEKDIVATLIREECDKIFQNEIKTTAQKEFSSDIESPYKQDMEQQTPYKKNNNKKKAPDTIKVGENDLFTIEGASKYLGGMGTAKIEKICKDHNLERESHGYRYLYKKEILDQVAKISLSNNKKQINETKIILPKKKRTISEEHKKKLQFNAAYAREVKKEKLANTLQN